MDCQKVLKVGGYSLSNDDPSIFKEACFITQDRAFPGEKYPTSKKSAQPVDSTSRSSAEPQPPPVADQDSIKALARMHQELLKMARQLGCNDLCGVDRANRAENVLAGITSKDLCCKYCKKKLSTVNHLKNHIRAMHLHKTAHYCEKCRRYFSESHTLKRHLSTHDEEASRKKCPYCEKSFPLQSRLDDHMVVHQQDKMYSCQFCQEKKYKRKKACKHHEGICDANPNKPARIKCRLCPKDYKTQDLYKRHFKTAHPGEDPFE